MRASHLYAAFAQSAVAHASKPAVFWSDADLSYQHFHGLSRWVAHHLRQSLGVSPGDRVGLWLRNRPEFIPAFLGILGADGVAVPINGFLKPAEVAYMLADAGIRVIVTESAMDDALRAIVDACPGLRAFHVEDLPAHAPDGVPDPVPARGADDLAVLIYTSGTTGHPKGAMLTHGNLLGNVASCRVFLELSEDDRLVVLLPMFHSFMLTVGLLLPLLSGASVVAVQGLHSPKHMIAEILQNRGTLLPAMAALFRALSQIPAGIEFTSLRLCVSGAGPLPMEILHAFQARHPKVPLIEGYGLSEASPVVTVNPPRDPKAGTIGVPIPGVEVTVQDDLGNPLPDGVDGEVCVRGANVMLGYWNAPEKTAETLRGGWLLTGDIGHRRSDGWFVITDRKKDMIVNDKGDNIAPQKLEGMLTLQPEIAQAMVVGDKRPYVVGLIVPDAEWALEWARAQDEKFDFKQLQDLPAFRSCIRAAVDRVNQDLSVIEKIRQFAFADEAFTIENEEMTPSMKIRRHKIRERYQERIDGLYRG